PSAAGQAGLPGSDGRRAGLFHAEYDAHVLANLDTLMTAWHAAWRGDRAGDIASFYADRALLILPDGVPLLGPREIEARLAELLPRIGAARASRLDFDASERLAYLEGTYELDLSPRGGGRTVRGRHVTAAIRDDEGWRIRAQLFFHRGEGATLRDDGRVGGPLEPDHARRATERRRNWKDYYEETYEEVQRTVAELSRVWSEDDLGTAARFYTPDARLHTPWGERIRGADLIHRWLQSHLPGAGRVHFAFLDFDASGRMAFAHGRYLLERAGSGGAEGPVVGPYVLVLRLDRDVRIRAQIMGRDPSGP
ncbi:MAG: DUF4440 domain-containing protein, partial [Gemmatimonadetes bacterium]|nr:DUF4440 domain-containing protein [Gemmatimonadota bacterium]NIR78566.1 DUF4440 domain-containing protein [Gemmatimonadota bacterium]NIT86567.1 DUF4440 domain-containing protein [Gemmatimonadota bacterium]NIU31020.1 DUF4440 domain-containing protein [Gemmatimonadota bacterium]NIU35774.1 DUF4440 domain-containing protein [Gemmatimonadota bacterium]